MMVVQSADLKACSMAGQSACQMVGPWAVLKADEKAAQKARWKVD
jgi:hypothetical protein